MSTLWDLRDIVAQLKSSELSFLSKSLITFIFNFFPNEYDHEKHI